MDAYIKAGKIGEIINSCRTKNQLAMCWGIIQRFSRDLATHENSLFFGLRDCYNEKLDKLNDMITYKFC